MSFSTSEAAKNRAFGPGAMKSYPYSKQAGHGTNNGVYYSSGPLARSYETKKGPSGPRPTKPNWYSQKGLQLT